MGSTFARFGGPENIRRASYNAYNSANGYISQNFGNHTLCLAFSGYLERNAFRQTNNKFGVCKINERNNYFGSMADETTRKEWERAGVCREALNKFSHVWNDDLKVQVAEALGARKTVVFTGHSIGGGIATLATLVSLAKWGKGAQVFAVTFGFPLIGDEVFATAVRRQEWDNHFFNVVSKSDVFARTLLAPWESVCRHLEFLLPHWQKSIEQDENETDIFMEPAEWGFQEYLSTVLQHAGELVKFITFTNMEVAKKLTASLKLAVELSPYRPFGSYLFCSDKGALYVENYEAEVVLPVLFYSLASSQDKIYIPDHTDYGKVFHADTKIVNLEGRQNLALTQGAALSSTIEILLDLVGFEYVANTMDLLGFEDVANTNIVEGHPSAMKIRPDDRGLGIQREDEGENLDKPAELIKKVNATHENVIRILDSITKIRNPKRKNTKEETEASKKKLKGKMIEEETEASQKKLKGIMIDEQTEASKGKPKGIMIEEQAEASKMKLKGKMIEEDVGAPAKMQCRSGA